MRGRSTSFDCIFRLIPKTLLAQVSKAGHLSKGLSVAEVDGGGWIGEGRSADRMRQASAARRPRASWPASPSRQAPPSVLAGRQLVPRHAFFRVGLGALHLGTREVLVAVVDGFELAAIADALHVSRLTRQQHWPAGRRQTRPQCHHQLCVGVRAVVTHEERALVQRDAHRRAIGAKTLPSPQGRCRSLRTPCRTCGS
jgi:hypothetical protein